MNAPTADSSSTSGQQRQSRKYAEDLERDAAAYPEEREEILLEAAGQWALAGEDERALRIYEELIVSASEEDAQWATASKIDVLTRIGRHEEAEAELARLRHSHVHPGPANMVAELLEQQERLDEALTWFNMACRDFLINAGEEITESALITQIELQGRARVRESLGLPPDALDQQVGEKRAELVEMLDRIAERGDPSSSARRSRSAGSFFIRSDVKRAFAEGLVHVDDPEDDDVTSYFRRVERGWRDLAGQGGAAPLQVLLPTSVDDLLKYAKERGRDPRDQQTRIDYLQDRIREGIPTVSWPPERNAPCWCGSGRKYKKCCGSPGNR